MNLTIGPWSDTDADMRKDEVEALDADCEASAYVCAIDWWLGHKKGH